jgi:hypothetical protein
MFPVFSSPRVRIRQAVCRFFQLTTIGSTDAITFSASRWLASGLFGRLTGECLGVSNRLDQHTTGTGDEGERTGFRGCSFDGGAALTGLPLDTVLQASSSSIRSSSRSLLFCKQ